MTVVRGDRRRLLAAVPLPPLGATAVRAVEAATEGPATVEHPVVVADRSLDNGLVEIDVADDGTWTIAGAGSRLTGAGRIVDGGDYGDTYNYGPPAEDRLVHAPSVVVVQPLERGPIRGSLDVVSRYDWPIGLTADGGARSGTTEPVEITTHLELRAAEPFVRVAVSFTNPSRDHRTRLHLPLPAATEHSSAEGQFAVVDRGLTVEAGHGEVPIATFPAHGFVHAAGVTVLLDQVTEYELVEGRELALTILRSTGLISRNDNPFREDPAGPEVPVPAAQLLGPWRFGFAVLPHAGSWAEADAIRAGDRYRLAAVTAPGRGPADAEARSTDGLGIEGDGVVLTALRRRGPELELRLLAETAGATTATIRLPGGIARAHDVDLLGREGGAVLVERTARPHPAPSVGDPDRPDHRRDARALRTRPRPEPDRGPKRDVAVTLTRREATISLAIQRHDFSRRPGRRITAALAATAQRATRR